MRFVDYESPRKKGSEAFFCRSLLIATIIVVAGLPLFWLAWQVALNPRVITEAWPDLFRPKLLARTLAYNGAVAVIATFLGFPVGVVLGRGRGRGRGVAARALWLMLPVSLLLPSLTYAYGWSQFFRLLNIWFEPTD